ncbi:emp24/gp25L/p24 family protein with transmembrane domain [Cryptosporidium ryanae]|uniref:emp24/gp25L/p24 family protein with transmembrane domain n=1 Tax=Cryptosporidium ryanae TaxID=515981 RepID=UPI00351A65D2|nr:emp24/gp25L/p24 family protein with transmembrane domain [Cryptosporidium ryanae]
MLANTLILFDSVSKEDINVIISDEKNTLFDQKEKHTKAAFSTIRNGIHRFCFANLSKNTNKVDIILKWGPSARDSKSIANKSDIEPIEGIIKDINIALKEYQEGVKQIKRTTSEIRRITSSASQRIAAFSLINIVAIIGINLVQAIYTKRFFKSRKLI